MEKVAPSSSSLEVNVSLNHETEANARSVHDTERDPGALKAAYRKADIRLLAWYSFVCILMKIEGHNIANAAIMNKEVGTDIKHQLGNLTSEQWAWALSIFHYSYLILEPASTLLLKRFTPRKWMSRIMITWGILSMCQGATQNFAGLLVCRLLLGAAEAGFLPGVLYHLSFWYPTHRLTLRIALFYSVSFLAGTLSGVLAFSISFLNGKAGLAGWRWLFIIEGAPAVICGIITLFLLPNYPETAKFLTSSQKRSVLAELPKTQPSSADKTWDWDQAKLLLKDPTTFTFYTIWTCHAIGAGGVLTVLPRVIHQLGLTNTATSQLMTMPPFLVGAIGLAFVAWLIQRQKLRSWIAAMCLEAMCCASYVALITVDHPLVRYILLMLATMAAIGVFPVLWPERIRAAHGAMNAGLSIGLTASAAQLHGIVGPQIYQSAFGPRYTVSFAISCGLLGVSIISIAGTWILVRRRDAKAGLEAEKHASESQEALRMDSGITRPV